MESCECNNRIDLKSKMTAPFILGLGLCVVAVILFFIGAFGPNNVSLWIATAVIGGASIILLAVSTHSTDGWIRMFSVLFIAAIVVILTYMATVSWAV